jgi:hypothetical protein
VFSLEEYNINTTIKIYDRDLKEIQSRITYCPEGILVGDNALVIYVRNGVSLFGESAEGALFFEKSAEKDYRYEFIEIIEKCIEWADIAKKNNVRQLKRTVKDYVNICGVSSRLEMLIADFTFSIQEINGNVEMLLIINYKTNDEQKSYYSQGRYIVFKEQDFNRLVS